MQDALKEQWGDDNQGWKMVGIILCNMIVYFKKNIVEEPASSLQAYLFFVHNWYIFILSVCNYSKTAIVIVVHKD